MSEDRRPIMGDKIMGGIQDHMMRLGQGLAIASAAVKENVKGMAKQAIIQRPMAALMTNLMEPFEPLTEIMGGVGSIIGAGLTPIMTEFYKFLLPMLPALQKGMELIAPALEAVGGAVGESLGEGTDPIIWAMTHLADTMHEATKAQEDLKNATERSNRIREEQPFGIEGMEFLAITGQLDAQRRAANS